MPVVLNVGTVLFDLDGTLIEPGIDFDDLNRRVLQVCARAGVDPRPWSHQPALEIIAQAVAQLRSANPDAAANLAITANRAIIEVELEAAARVRPYPGVEPMLATLICKGYRVGIVTRNSREAVDVVLGRWPLPCQVLLTRDDVPHVKPDPRHLRAALAALGAGDGSVLMVGDHPMDIAAGKAIGAFTALVRTEQISIDRVRDAGADLVLERVTDLVHYLDGRAGAVGLQA